MSEPSSDRSVSFQESDVTLMTSVLEQKEGEVRQLQQYLYQQLRGIEDSRDKYQKFNQLFKAKILEHMTILRQIIQQFKGIMLPLSVMSRSAIQAVADKAHQAVAQHLKQKDELKEEIKILKQRISQLEQEGSPQETSHNMEPTPSFKESKDKDLSPFRRQISLCSLDNPYTLKSQNSSKTVLLSHTESAFNEVMNRRGSRQNYEHKRSAYSIKRRSPSCTTHSNNMYKKKTEEDKDHQDVRQRKQIIRQKIERLKARNECKGYCQRSPPLR